MLPACAGPEAGGTAAEVPRASGAAHDEEPPRLKRRRVTEAVGIFGRRVYVNPREKVVIVVWGALPRPTGKEPVRDEDVFAAVSHARR